MARTVQCAKLNKEAEGLDRPPLPGGLGQRLYEQVSKEAWRMWIAHQTMLINEYRLVLADPESRKFLQEEMEKYFFGEGARAPEGYRPPEAE
ncbi:MAG: oxidative damage protection protein [Pseudomonadota bacterium]|nr:oxidative damage protection protein [Pseudomonadota bacterium]